MSSSTTLGPDPNPGGWCTRWEVWGPIWSCHQCQRLSKVAKNHPLVDAHMQQGQDLNGQGLLLQGPIDLGSNPRWGPQQLYEPRLPRPHQAVPGRVRTSQAVVRVRGDEEVLLSMAARPAACESKRPSLIFLSGSSALNREAGTKAALGKPMRGIAQICKEPYTSKITASS